MSTPTRRAAAWAMAIAASSPIAAWADRPLVSDTADTIAEKSCQIESAVSRESARGSASAVIWDHLFSCAATADTQLALGFSSARSDGESTRTYLLGGKTSLRQPEAGRTGWGVSYAVTWDQSPGLATRFDEVRVIALATRELATGVLGHANLGRSHSRVDGRSRGLWSLGIETTGDLTFAGDVFGVESERPSISTGVGYVIGNGFSVNLAYAVRLDTPQVRTLGLGAKLSF